MLDRQLRNFSSDANAPVKQNQIQSSFRRGLLFNPVIDLFKNPWHAHENCWSNFAQVRTNRVERLAKINFHAVIQIHVHGAAFEYVRER